MHGAHVTLRVLVADRPGPARRALCQLLADLDGVVLVGAEDGGPALGEAVDRLGPDVLVIDDRLLGSWHPAAGRAMRLVVVGVDDHPGYAERAARAGAEAWLPKDRAAEALSDALDEVRASMRREDPVFSRM